MNEFMDWAECKRKFIREIFTDTNKIKAILKAIEKREKMLAYIPETTDTISFIIENQYEILKELLVALLLTKGLKSNNHQCMISYFYKNYPEYESHAYLISQLCYLRNRLVYYGELIEETFHEKNKDKIKKAKEVIIKLIKR